MIIYLTVVSVKFLLREISEKYSNASCHAAYIGALKQGLFSFVLC